MRVVSLLCFFVLSVAISGCFGCGKNRGPKKLTPCGNGELDEGELCDPEIAEGEPGACPTDCGGPCSGQEPEGNPAACNVRCVAAPVECGLDDGCCPAGCSEDEDDDCSAEALCGNGVLDPGEDCDPNVPFGGFGACACPEPPGSCMRYVQGGDASQCEITCDIEPITACTGGDGCCPDGCTSVNDSDCGDVCGDGIVGPTETCDGNCPTNCDDGNDCTENVLSGSAASCDAVCTNPPITSCVDGDGCCPDGCTSATDSDCPAVCGNGIVDEGETCDGDCPADCDDGRSCTNDVRQGSAATCDVVCINDPITACTDGDDCCPAGCTSANDSDCSATCGDGVIDPGETCDGNCPTAADCDDGDACTVDVLIGSAANCNAECDNSPITACIDGDGCCPAACDATNDSDCAAICGNGIVEGNETCDGNCPTAADCDDFDACTTDSLIGDAATCTAECSHVDITQCITGDGCCPAGCTFDMDEDCPCTPDTCASLGWTCGVVEDDGCGGGGELCGTCPNDQTCVDNNQCELHYDVGNACLSDTDCAGVEGACIDELTNGWDDGYCSRSCQSDADCGVPNHCGASGFCWKSCSADTDCRTGYLCFDDDGDGVDECAPAATGTGAVGAPCARFGDCAGGASGWCATEASQFNGGFCSRDCTTDADCPTGTHCYASEACVPDCADSTACRGDGYECYDADGDGSTECFRFANGPGAVGDACAGMWECAGGQWGWCHRADEGWPGGYCTIFCAAGAGSCGQGSSCYDAGGSSYCLDNCQNDNQCRADYQCLDPGTLGTTACIP